jgi:hypothetical protein
MPNLQVGPQVNWFLEGHLGYAIRSPALMQQIGTRFRREVKAFAAHVRFARPTTTPSWARRAVSLRSSASSVRLVTVAGASAERLFSDAVALEARVLITRTECP